MRTRSGGLTIGVTRPVLNLPQTLLEATFAAKRNREAWTFGRFISSGSLDQFHGDKLCIRQRYEFQNRLLCDSHTVAFLGPHAID